MIYQQSRFRDDSNECNQRNLIVTMGGSGNVNLNVDGGDFTFALSDESFDDFVDLLAEYRWRRDRIRGRDGEA